MGAYYLQVRVAKRQRSTRDYPLILTFTSQRQADLFESRVRRERHDLQIIDSGSHYKRYEKADDAFAELEFWHPKETIDA